MRAFGGRPLVLGHRGARLEAPENTLPAFRRALELGADGVELDVQLTADGEAVVLHDVRLERTTDGRGRVDHVSLADLRRVDAGIRFRPDFVGTQIPTLAEALEVLAAAGLVNVELKGTARGDDGLEKRALEVVRGAGMLDRVIFSSFSPASLGCLRRLDEGVALAWLYNWPWQRGTALDLVDELNLQALHPGRRAVSKRLVQQAHERGLWLVPWTVNEEATVHRFLSWQVDGLITDRPGEVRRWLEERIAPS